MFRIEMREIPVDFRDSGAWRCYELSTFGNNKEEMLENAIIGEIDQDGGELDCYDLGDATGEIEKAVEKMIDEELETAK